VLSTDTTLCEAEIIRIYGIRISIEVFFKMAMSLLRRTEEFHCNNCNALVAHTSIVFSRYLLMEWELRQNQDHRTIGDLCYQLYDEVSDMYLKTALAQLMAFFTQLKKQFSLDTDFVVE
jgi:hypothetical protein